MLVLTAENFIRSRTSATLSHGSTPVGMASDDPVVCARRLCRLCGCWEESSIYLTVDDFVYLIVSALRKALKQRKDADSVSKVNLLIGLSKEWSGRRAYGLWLMLLNEGTG